MGPYECAVAGGDEQISLSLSLSTSGDWSYLPQSRSIFHHQCVRGKAIKTALLFLSIMRISTRFSEIPPRALEIFGIFPLKCFLMDCSEVSETLVRLECSFLDFSVFIWSWNDKNLKYECTWTFHIINQFTSSLVYNSRNNGVCSHWDYFKIMLRFKQSTTNWSGELTRV